MQETTPRETGEKRIGARVRALPTDGTVPEMPGWRAIHTPGHSPGHISLYREADRLLIAGDAFVTTKQESAIAATGHGVPMQGAELERELQAFARCLPRLYDAERSQFRQ